MIHVQIASQLTADGVDGIRWVLVEPTEGGQRPAPTPAAALATTTDSIAATQPEAALPSSVRLNLLKGLVILLGLGAALGLSRMQFGAPTVRWWAPAPEPALQPPPQPTNAQPVQPAPVPAQPGSAGSLVVKATTS